MAEVAERERDVMDGESNAAVVEHGLPNSSKHRHGPNPREEPLPRLKPCGRG